MESSGMSIGSIKVTYGFVCHHSGSFITLRPRQNGRHFTDDIFKCIFLNENARISLKISLKFVPKARINNIPALVQIMAWRCSGDKPLSESMLVSLPTHICVTRPQWVKVIWWNSGLSPLDAPNSTTLDKAQQWKCRKYHVILWPHSGLPKYYFPGRL